jgi:hypothetical protein
MWRMITHLNDGRSELERRPAQTQRRQEAV